MYDFTWGEFIAKLDWEGGIEDMIGWGGYECFPQEIRENARQLKIQMDIIHNAIEAHDDEYQEYLRSEAY